MNVLKRAVGTVAATTLVTSGLAGTAAAAEPTAPPTAAEQQLVEELLGLLINGIGQLGETLSVAQPVGAELPLVSMWDIEWLRDGLPIPGADDWSYVPGFEDLGHQVQARVTGLLLGIPIISGLTEALPISGDPLGGLDALMEPILRQLTDRLQVSPLGPAGWSLPGVTEAVQWFRDAGSGGVPIPGADEWEYFPAPEDAGAELYAVVTGTLGTLPVVSLVTQRIQLPGGALEATRPATIKPADASQGAKVGAVLIAVDPEWNTEDVTNTYQWKRAGAPIAAATRQSYTVTAEDAGKQLTVVVTGTKKAPITGQETTGTSTSAPVTAALGDAPTVVAAPSISGAPAVGGSLTVDPGTWRYATGTATPTFEYHWLRGGTLIGGATGQRYTPTSADAGKALSVRVTAKRAGYADGHRISPSVQVPGTGVDEPGTAAAQLQLELAEARVARGTRAVLRIVLGAEAGTPTGKVQVRQGRQVIKAYRITERHDGVRTVRLPRLKPGRYRLHGVYLGSTSHDRARSTRVTLRVVRTAR